MHFKFTPLFLIFFRNFKYLPPSLNFKFTPYSKQNFNLYFFNLIKKNKSKLSFISIFKKFSSSYANFIKKKIPTPLFELSVLYNTNIYGINFFSNMLNAISNFKFIFYFFTQKLNKKLYRFSKQKRPRYSMYFKYLPPFRRFKFLIKFIQKTVTYLQGRSFINRLYRLIFLFIVNPDRFFIFNYLKKLQVYIFKENKRFMLSV